MNDLSASALVTLEEARSYCWRDENDGSRDALLVDALNAVSPAIATHCEREFVEASGTPTRTFALRARGVNGWIDLAPYDLQSASVVKLYTDQAVASQQTLTVDEYRLRPVGGTLGGTYLSILTIPPTASEEQEGFEWEAQVTGVWGMAAVPADVKLAALEWVKNLTANPGSFLSSSQAGYDVSPDLAFATFGHGMPRSVQYRLQPYRRRP